jgi:hypothetical protein
MECMESADPVLILPCRTVHLWMTDDPIGIGICAVADLKAEPTTYRTIALGQVVKTTTLEGTTVQKSISSVFLLRAVALAEQIYIL